MVPEPLSMPFTRIVRAPAVCAWVRRSAQLDTVTVGPLAPPVVPPACVAQPTIPPGGGGVVVGGGVLVGGVEGVGEVVGDVDGEVGGAVVGLGPAASVTSTLSKLPAT
ncbi:hypothetical protein GCM10022251_38810 [Phytohabitans flavus]